VVIDVDEDEALIEAVAAYQQAGFLCARRVSRSAERLLQVAVPSASGLLRAIEFLL